MSSNDPTGNYRGTVFKLGLSVEPPLYSILQNFDQTTDTVPQAGMYQATDGKLYETAFNGGNNGLGTIFQIDDSFSPPALKLLHKFETNQGAYPTATLVEGGSGIFYGATGSGRLASSGVIYELNNSGNALVYKVIHHFNMGENAIGRIIKASDGHIYGVTKEGGNFNRGSIFRIRLDGVPSPYQHSPGCSK